MSHYGIVIVHVGAGYHSPSRAVEYKKTCADALVIATALLRAGGDAADVAMETVSVLEASEITNAGRGSNLALDGSVRCDAGLMADWGGGARFAAVGAVPNQPHPIRLAHHMLQIQRRGLSLGRQPPSLLVGECANDWAQEHGFVCRLPPQSSAAAPPGAPLTATDPPLVTRQSLERYHKGMRQLQLADHCATSCSQLQTDRSADLCSATHGGAPSLKRARLQTNATKTEQCDAGGCGGGAEKGGSVGPDGAGLSDRFDTVGAVVIDCAGSIASAVSSGGILLKHPGRVGQAAVFGSGCWADAAATTGTCGVGSCTSGLGEQLVMTCLARRVAAEVFRCEHTVQGVQTAVKHGFLGSSYIERDAERVAGTVVLRHEPHLNAVDLAWCHCASSFVVGYQSTEHQKPQTLCSRLPAEADVGSTVLAQGVTLHFQSCSSHVRHSSPPTVISSNNNNNDTTTTTTTNNNNNSNNNNNNGDDSESWSIDNDTVAGASNFVV